MKKVVVFVCVLSVAALSGAATIRYQDSGDWFDVDTSDGNGWQGGVLPGAADTIRANWGGWTGNTITLDGAAPDITKFQLGVDESGTLVVGSGGSLTTTSDSRVGNNNWVTGKLIINGGTVNNNSWFGIATGNGGTKPATWHPSGDTWGATTGVVEINGGTLNIKSHLWAATGSANASSLGAPTSLAYIDINAGGVINVGENLGLGTIDAVNPSAGGGQALLNVNDGGILNLHHWNGDGNGSIQAGSLLSINGSGKVTILGDWLGSVDLYAANGRLAGNGVVGNVSAELIDGYTVITAIPEPATMSLLALGALALIRKRK